MNKKMLFRIINGDLFYSPRVAYITRTHLASVGPITTQGDIPCIYTAPRHDNIAKVKVKLGFHASFNSQMITQPTGPQKVYL